MVPDGVLPRNVDHFVSEFYGGAEVDDCLEPSRWWDDCGSVTVRDGWLEKNCCGRIVATVLRVEVVWVPGVSPAPLPQFDGDDDVWSWPGWVTATVAGVAERAA
jgi:hypothetical protein